MGLRRRTRPRAIAAARGPDRAQVENEPYAGMEDSLIAQQRDFVQRERGQEADGPVYGVERREPADRNQWRGRNDANGNLKNHHKRLLLFTRSATSVEKQKMCARLLAASNLATTLYFGYTVAASKAYMEDVNLKFTIRQIAWLFTSYFIGAVLSSFICAFRLHKEPRVKVIENSAIFTIFTWIIEIFMDQYFLLLIIRFFMGFIMGAQTAACTAYKFEALHIKHLSRIRRLFSFLTNIGFLFMLISGAVVRWRILSVIGCVGSIYTYSAEVLKESPAFKYQDGDVVGAVCFYQHFLSIKNEEISQELKILRDRKKEREELYKSPNLYNNYICFTFYLTIFLYVCQPVFAIFPIVFFLKLCLEIMNPFWVYIFAIVAYIIYGIIKILISDEQIIDNEMLQSTSKYVFAYSFIASQIYYQCDSFNFILIFLVLLFMLISLISYTFGFGMVPEKCHWDCTHHYFQYRLPSLPLTGRYLSASICVHAFYLIDSVYGLIAILLVFSLALYLVTLTPLILKKLEIYKNDEWGRHCKDICKKFNILQG